MGMMMMMMMMMCADFEIHFKTCFGDARQIPLTSGTGRAMTPRHIDSSCSGYVSQLWDREFTER
jgi:hypothetical protein